MKGLVMLFIGIRKLAVLVISVGIFSFSNYGYAAEKIVTISFDQNDPKFFKKKLPEMEGIKYDVKQIKFDSASINQVKAAFQGTDKFKEIDEYGNITTIQIDLNSVPYWLYARYTELKPNKCEYVLVDGFTRLFPNGLDLDEPIEKAPIKWIDQDFGAVIMRDCGTGYNVISSESYDSIFDEQDDSLLSKLVIEGLADDYVNRLLKAFNGKSELYKLFNEDKNCNFYNAPNLIAKKLKENGFKLSCN